MFQLVAYGSPEYVWGTWGTPGFFGLFRYWDTALPYANRRSLVAATIELRRLRFEERGEGRPIIS